MQESNGIPTSDGNGGQGSPETIIVETVENDSSNDEGEGQPPVL